jgi:pyruvate/2-oxoglutarate/acetoin dehydrogenase E1 component/TPP-dependent pyruvate/acetoin dehydrogenase alpha subunit
MAGAPQTPRPRPDRELYEALCLVREFDDRVSILHKQGKIVGGAYSGRGQEAIQVGICQVLQDGDVIFPLHRDLGVPLLRGIDPGVLMAGLLGRRDGLSGGRDSFLHTGDPSKGVIGATSMLGATLPVATGVALAFRIRRRPNISVALFGEGATSRGDFHEALNFAGIHKLPVLFLCENNFYAYSTPTRLQMPVETVAERAEAYGMRGVRVNGNDLLRVLSVTEEAVRRARAGEGPTLIECLTYRIHGHSEHDPARYREQEELVEWEGRDPIELYELHLAKRGHDVAAMREETKAKVRETADRAIAFAEASPFPDPREALEAIWCNPNSVPAGPPADPGAPRRSGGPTESSAGLPVRAAIPDGTMHWDQTAGVDSPARSKEGTTYIEALRRALDEEMERDENVILIGEDIGALGGAFGVTKGLIEKFGGERVIDTPISESLIVGAAIGAGIVGMRAVAEVQFADFISCGFDQIVNTAATLSYRHSGRVASRLVIRAPSGARIHGGLFHSQNVEAFFLSTPGLKIVAPATAEDARGLLKSAIRDDDPVIFLEYKYLYRRERAELSAAEDLVPIGVAAVRRPGRDLSIVTYGPTLPYCMEAAATLAGEGIEAEVIDLRSLKPLDMDAIRTSVRKTGRLMIVHEDRRFSGLGAEISARLAEEDFEALDGPILRVTTPDTHYAYSPPLEEAILPDTEKILAAARKLGGY